MKIVFAGTPEFAAVALQRLLDAGFEVPLVLTQPDRPAGRGMKLQASPVKQVALDKGIAVSQPRSLRLDGKYPEDAAAAREALLASGADCMVVAAYGLILPSTPACCRAGAEPRRFTALSKRVMQRLASRSCRWTSASIPATCC